MTLKRDTTDIKEQVIKDHIDFIQGETQGNILVLGAAPTATEPLLEDGDRGKFGNDIYERVGSSILKFSSDSQITIE